jgi:hypothetical protein
MFQATTKAGLTPLSTASARALRVLMGAGAVAAALLAGCASPPPEAAKPPVFVPTVEKFQATLGDGITLDYQVEKKLSQVNKRSCFAYITGKLNNTSGTTLSKQSVLDIAVFSQGKQLYRDNSRPMADVLSGFNAPFEMVVSPVFADGCPLFDKITVALRKASS